MAERSDPQVRPFTTFNFKVVFTLDGQDEPLCHAAFAECDGLEMTMEPKTYQEGGNNLAQIHLPGPVTYAQLTLKRGMTDDFGLWKWFDRVLERHQGLRVDGLVQVLDSVAGGDARASFLLSRCLPVKLKAPALNAASGGVAVEELQVAYERLRLL